MPKEFGKFTAEQIREFIDLIPKIQKDRSDYLTYLRNNPHKLNESMSEPLKWSWTYELPINEHIARLAMECGEGENLVEMSIADDPQQAVLDDMKAIIDPPLKLKNPQSLLALVEALVCSLECVVIYGRYINDIIADVRAGIKGSAYLGSCLNLRMKLNFIVG